MKRLISIILVLMLSSQLLTSSAFAIDAESQYTPDSEMQIELAYAESILGGPCRLDVQTSRVVGNYIVEDRLYVLDDTASLAAQSGEISGVSSHVWRPITSSSWTYKVLLSASFYYNGTTAICQKEDSKIWCILFDGSKVTSNFNSSIRTSDGSTAKVTGTYSYVINSGGDSISETIKVTCTGAGKIEIVTEEGHVY